MDFIKEHVEYVITIGFILTTILVTIILTMNVKMSKYFSNKKFRVRSFSDLNPVNQERHFSIHIFNNNVNDVRITALGFMYQNQSIDYYQSYLLDQELPTDYKVSIISRGFIVVKVSIDQLKNLITDINKNKFKVTKISTYIIDSLGLLTVIPANQVRNHIIKLIKADRQALLLHQKEQAKKSRDEQKLLNQNKRLERKLKRKEFYGKVKFKIKNLFKRKSK